MVESAALRAIRLIDLVPYLVSNPGVTVKQTAEAFGITSSELLKDLDILFMCGLPGYTPLELIDLSVEDGYISIRDPQNLEAPRRFTESEALILRVALSALEEILPQEKRHSVRKVREKVSKLFSSEIPGDALFYQGDPTKRKMAIISKAVELEKKISFTYFNPLRTENSVRTASVIRIKAEPAKTLIEAWCDKSGGLRTFNLAQMEDIEIADDGAESHKAKEKTGKLVARFIAPTDCSFVKENESSITVKDEGYEIEIFQPEWLIRNVLSSAGEITLKDPASMVVRVQDLATRALELYR